MFSTKIVSPLIKQKIKIKKIKKKKIQHIISVQKELQINALLT